MDLIFLKDSHIFNTKIYQLLYFTACFAPRPFPFKSARIDAELISFTENIFTAHDWND